jgi:hypothetical protein
MWVNFLLFKYLRVFFGGGGLCKILAVSSSAHVYFWIRPKRVFTSL